MSDRYDVSANATYWFDAALGETGDPAAGTNEGGTLTGSNFTFGISNHIPGGGGSIDYGQGSIIDWSLVTIPSGFEFLNSASLPAPTIKNPAKHFAPLLYTGNGAVRSITGLNFQPDLVWIKNRDQADEHKLIDAVRGATKELTSDSATDESTNANGLTAFNTDGFTLGTGANGYNDNGEGFVSWNWKGDNSAGASNTNGTITSTVSANTAAGFSIVTYTGNGIQGATVGHGLSTAPDMIIQMARSTGGANLGRFVFHSSNTSAPETDHLLLDTSAATSDDHNTWDDTAATLSVFSVGGSGGSGAGNTNVSGDTYVAYCFAEISGYSKFGSYAGNAAADGPFIWCGFRPSWLMVKNTSVSSNWVIWDKDRNSYNPASHELNADDPAAEDANVPPVDLLSNGFKLRTSAQHVNGSSHPLIFAAFAEAPFKYANAR